MARLVRWKLHNRVRAFRRGFLIATKPECVNSIYGVRFSTTSASQGNKPLGVADNPANTLVSLSGTGFHYPQNYTMNL